MAGGDWKGGLARAAAAARALGIEEHVRFLGWVDDADLPKLYRGARAMIMASTEETFGRSVTEAMACGCPCVLQDLPVLREVTAGNAVFCDFADPLAASSAIDSLCRDDALAGRLRSAGLRRAAQFSFRHLAHERLSAIVAVLRRR
jgi:glycosyltransferase involved in cell wall biosynthesis